MVGCIQMYNNFGLAFQLLEIKNKLYLKTLVKVIIILLIMILNILTVYYKKLKINSKRSTR